MGSKFIDLFRNNIALTDEDKDKLVSSLSDYLVFDPVFSLETPTPPDLANLLKNYGWLWVTISDPESSKRSDVVVNDITDNKDAETAVVHYFDNENNRIKEVSFNSFLLAVKNTGKPARAVIRLKKTAGEGSSPPPQASFMPSSLQNPNSNLSLEYNYYSYVKGNGSRCEVSEGELKVPSQVSGVRDKNIQRAVSGGTGDDAGHRIGTRFDGAPDYRNLARQNRIQNQWGTWYDLEDEWAELLESNVRIRVRVTDVYKPGSPRPFMRRAEWEETHPNGEVKTSIRDFMNTRSFPLSAIKRDPPSIRVNLNPTPLTTNELTIPTSTRVKAGVMLGVELLMIGLEVYNTIDGIYKLSGYRRALHQVESIRNLNWWLFFDIRPDIALVNDGEILVNTTSEKAYEIIRNPEASEGFEWDQVVVTDIKKSDLDKLLVRLSQEINLMLWMYVLGNPDIIRTQDEEADVDKIGTVSSKLSRYGSKWYYKKWDSARSKVYSYPMPDECSDKFEELYEELIELAKAEFAKATAFTVKDTALVGVNRNCYVYTSGAGVLKEIDFDDTKPRFSKEPAFAVPEPGEPWKAIYHNADFNDKPYQRVYAADIDTLYKLSLYKWQLTRDALPSNDCIIYNNFGCAWALTDSLVPF